MKTLPKINFLLRTLPVLIIIVVSFSKPTLSSAQNAPKLEWQKCYGGSDNEDPDHSRRSFVQTSDGGYVIAHRAKSNDYDVSGNHVDGSSKTGDDAWVFKINSFGTIEWQKCIGGFSSDDSYCIIRTSDNGFIFCGWTSSNDGDVSGHHPEERGSFGSDAWVVKLDSIGNIQWSKCYGGSRGDFATSIIQTLDGGYAFTGYTNSVDGDVSGNHILIRQGGFPNDTLDDAWVVKINALGTIEWQNCLGSTGEEYAWSIIQTADSGYAIVGSTTSKEEGFPNYGDYDAYIVKLTSSGGFQWQQIYGDTLSDGATSILQTTDGGYIFGGTTNFRNVFTFPHTGDFWIVSLDTIGRKLWEKSYGGSGWSSSASLIKTAEGGYAMVGNSSANDRDITGNHGGRDVCVFKLTSTGDKIWQKSLGGSSDDFGYIILQTPDGGYAINGCTYSNNGDVSGNHSFSAYPDQNLIDVWFVKLSPESNSVENSSSNGIGFLNAFPNPASDQIHLQLSGSLTLKQVSFYNLMGTQYFPEYKLEQNVATVDVHTLPSGSFIARIVYQDSHQNYLEQVQKFLHYR